MKCSRYTVYRGGLAIWRTGTFPDGPASKRGCDMPKETATHIATTLGFTVDLQFCLLHGTSLVYQERAWYLEHNYLTPNTSRQIRSQLLELCRSVKDDALKVVADFNVPFCCIQAPIAGVTNPRAEWAFYAQPQYPSSGLPLSKL